MEIYGLNGNLLLNPPTTQDAVHVEELMMSDYVRLSWNDTSKVKLPVGAYVVFDGVKYSLLDEYTPQSVSECSFKYEPEFQHPYMALGRMPLPYYGKDANNQEVVDYDWNITDKPANILAYICACINKALGIEPRSDVGWGFVLTSPLDVVTATCSFNSVDILSGLAEICNKFSTDSGIAEYVIDWENRVIRFGVNISVGSGISLKVGENICPASVNGSKEKYYNRFVVKDNVAFCVSRTPFALSTAICMAVSLPSMRVPVSSDRERSSLMVAFCVSMLDGSLTRPISFKAFISLAYLSTDVCCNSLALSNMFLSTFPVSGL